MALLTIHNGTLFPAVVFSSLVCCQSHDGGDQETAQSAARERNGFILSADRVLAQAESTGISYVDRDFAV